MKTTKATIFALAILMPMLIMAFAVAPAQAKSPDLKLVETRNVCENIDLGDISILIDGKAHINMVATAQDCNLDVKLHFDWHGIIIISTECGMKVAIDSKNLQLDVHASIPMCNPCESDIWVNFHTNSVVYIGGCECIKPIDLKVHIILDIDNGSIDMLKIMLPDFADAPIF